jgi:hypothetical protein|tara:strand:+ start:2095 stop:2280 length:186 start_codon:yes stop_codon:yes gene_type:complete
MFISDSFCESLSVRRFLQIAINKNKNNSCTKKIIENISQEDINIEIKLMVDEPRFELGASS